MLGSTLRRTAALAACLATAPLALPQQADLERATIPEHWGFIVVMAGFGMLFVLGIIAIGSFTENRRTRQRLELVERLVTNGQPVPRELMVNEPRQLTLTEERRTGLRRGIALLCWGIGIGVVFYIVYGGNPRAASWGLLFIVPGLGNFLRAWLAAREIARGSADVQR